MKISSTADHIKAFTHWSNQPVDIRLFWKNLTTLLFLVALLFQTFHKPFIVAGYYVDNSNYEALCENKAKPELQCHGKCQVAKKLAAEEKKDQQNPERRSENRTELIGNTLGIDELVPPSFDLIISKKISRPNAGPLSDPSFDFFHPPQA